MGTPTTPAPPRDAAIPERERQPITRDDIQGRLASVRDVWFKIHGIDPPTSLYVRPEDQIHCWANSSLAGVIVNVYFRLLRLDGTIVPILVQLRPAGGYPPTSGFQALQGTEGFLLSCEATIDSSGTQPVRGQTYVWVQYSRFAIAQRLGSQVLIANYVESLSTCSWPGTPLRSALEGPGLIRSIAIAAPAAGADMVAQIVPTGTRWKLRSMFGELTTGVAVANRFPALTIRNTVPATIARVSASAAQAASLTFDWTWFPGSQLIAAAAVVNAPLPQEYILAAGFDIAIVTANLQAADQWTLLNLVIEEWLAP